MHFLIISETIKEVKLPVIKEAPQNATWMDILRLKYALVFQKYISKCFIRLKVVTDNMHVNIFFCI